MEAFQGAEAGGARREDSGPRSRKDKMRGSLRKKTPDGALLPGSHPVDIGDGLEEAAVFLTDRIEHRHRPDGQLPVPRRSRKPFGDEADPSSISLPAPSGSSSRSPSWLPPSSLRESGTHQTRRRTPGRPGPPLSRRSGTRDGFAKPVPSNSAFCQESRRRWPAAWLSCPFFPFPKPCFRGRTLIKGP